MYDRCEGCSQYKEGRDGHRTYCSRYGDFPNALSVCIRDSPESSSPLWKRTVRVASVLRQLRLREKAALN